MSRHDHLGSTGPGRPTPPSPGFRAGKRWATAVQVLGREAILGAVLWACNSPDYWVEIPAFALIFMVLVGLTKRFGVSRPTKWRGALFEAALVFFGAVCAANLVSNLYGSVPWSRGY